MVRLVNRLTGTEMWVHETRLSEYLAAGHVPAASPEGTKEPEPKKTVPKKTKGTKKGG